MKRELSRREAIGAALAALRSAVGASRQRPWRRAFAARSIAALDATHEGLNPGAPDDQSEAFARALAKAEAEGRPLFLPPGRYEVGEIALPNSAHIVGVPGQSRVRFRGGSALFTRAPCRHGAPGGTDARRRRRCRSAPGAGAARRRGRRRSRARRLRRSWQSGGAGARFAPAPAASRTRAFTTIGTIGLWLDQSRGMRVERQRRRRIAATPASSSPATRRATTARSSRGNRVSSIRADSGGTGQNGNGINLDKANGVIVADNRVDDCAFSAIRCFSSDNISVTGNIATHSGEMALYVEFAFEGAIVANNLIDGGNGGISFANFFEHGGRLGVCSGNIVRNIRGGPTYPDGNLQIGAGIAAEADVAITGNVVEDAVWGLQLGWGPYLRDVTATGNVIRRTKIGIAVSVVEGAGPAVISDNLISERRARARSSARGGIRSRPAS